MAVQVEDSDTSDEDDDEDDEDDDEDEDDEAMEDDDDDDEEELEEGAVDQNFRLELMKVLQQQNALVGWKPVKSGSSAAAEKPSGGFKRQCHSGNRGGRQQR